MYYEVDGNGHPLVLIHAGFLDHRMWNEQFQLFTKHYRVISYDVRGYGKSDRPKASLSDCDDLHALLRHLEVQKAHLVGVSNGGRIALDFAVTYPEMVNALVLIGTGVKGYEVSGPDEEKVWDEFDRQMKRQEEAVREDRLADAAKIDVDTWASAQTPSSRKRLLDRPR